MENENLNERYIGYDNLYLGEEVRLYFQADGDCNWTQELAKLGLDFINAYSTESDKTERFFDLMYVSNVQEFIELCKGIISVDFPEKADEISDIFSSSFVPGNNDSIMAAVSFRTCNDCYTVYFDYDGKTIKEYVITKNNFVNGFDNRDLYDIWYDSEQYEYFWEHAAAINPTAVYNSINVMSAPSSTFDSRQTTQTAVPSTPANNAPAVDLTGYTKIPASDCDILNNGRMLEYTGHETRIILPDGVTGFGMTFANNTEIESIIIPAGIETIEQFSFNNCTNLKNVIFPNTVVTIEQYAFSGCENLESINLPDSIKTIGVGAFDSDPQLTCIVIPSGCNTIESNCFSGCDNLKDIYVPASVKEIGEDAFKTYNDETVVHCPKGSYAERYCLENDVPYVNN